jgi:hypothetical protein
MATAKKKSASPAVDDPTTFQEVAPIDGYDLTSKLPVWSPKADVAFKGLLLGLVNLPSVQPNQEYWRCFLVELTGPTKVQITGEDGKVTERVATAGEKVLVTATAVLLSRLEVAAVDKARVFEVYVKPAGTEKTKGGTFVNVFKPLIVGKAFARSAKYQLPSSPTPKALPDAPFDDAQEFPED